MNDVWAMDFLSDRLFDGRPFRILTVVDRHTRESLSTASRTNFRAYQVVEVLDRVVHLRGKPKNLRVDNAECDSRCAMGPSSRAAWSTSGRI